MTLLWHSPGVWMFMLFLHRHILNACLCKPKSVLQKDNNADTIFIQQLLFLMAAWRQSCLALGKRDQLAVGCFRLERSVPAVSRRRWSLVPGFLMNWPVLYEAAGRSRCPAGAHQTDLLSYRLDNGEWIPAKNRNMPNLQNSSQGHPQVSDFTTYRGFNISFHTKSYEGDALAKN